MLFPRNGPQAKWGLADHHWFGRLDPAYDECDQVGGHLDRIGEADDLLSSSKRFGRDRGVGDSDERRIDDQRRGKDGFEVRFIPAGERPTGIGGFELRRGYAVSRTTFVFVGAAIEPTELIV